MTPLMEATGKMVALLRERFPEIAITVAYPWQGPGDGERTHGVGLAACTVTRWGDVSEVGHGQSRVDLDTACDLAAQPQVRIGIESGDLAGPITWLVMTLAFIEEEAREACERVGPAVPEAWAQASRERSLSRT